MTFGEDLDLELPLLWAKNLESNGMSEYIYFVCV